MVDLMVLRAVLGLDSTEFDAGLSKVEGAINGVKKIATVAFAAASAAATAFLKSSVDTGIQFDKSMSQVAATMGTTTDEIQELSDFAREMGETTAFSAIQASEALNYMALAGYDAKTSMRMLPTVLDLAAAGNMDLARASDMVTDAQTALGLTLDGTSDMVNQMAKAASRSNTSVEQLGDAFLTIGGTAQLMAGGTDRLATVFGILADNGIKGSEAGTHLRNILLKLSSPTNEGAKAMEQLGVNIFDAQGKMRDMQDVMSDLSSAMAGLTDEQRIKYISEMFNTRDIAAVNALLNTTTDRWNELGDAIQDSAGSAGKMAHTQLDNLSGDLTLFRSKMEGVRLTVYRQLEPAIRKLVDTVSKIVDRIDWRGFGRVVSSMLESVGKSIVWVADHSETLLAIVKSLGVAFVTFKVASFVSGIVSVVGAISSAVTAAGSFSAIIKGLTAALNVNPFVLAATAIAGVVTAIVLLTNKSRELSPEIVALQEATESFTTSIDQQTEAYRQAQQTRDDFVASAESEMGYYEGLLEELNSIVDENGLIKEGYEERAKTITGVLSDAFGVEIENNGKVIKGYQKIQEEIRKTIDAKKAEAKLQASEQAWKEALQNREKVVLQLQQAHEKLTEIETAESQKKQEHAELSAKLDKMLTESGGERFDAETRQTQERIVQLGEELKAITSNKEEMAAKYNDLSDTVAGYSYDIEMYERNVGLAAQGAYDKIAYISPEVAKELANMTEEQRKQYEASIGYSTEFATDLYNESVKVGQNITKGMEAGVNDPSFVASLKKKAANVAFKAVTAAKQELQVRSPSKVMAQVGRFFVEGFTEGIEDNERSVIKQVSELSNAAVDAFDTAGSYDIFANGVASTMRSTPASSPLSAQTPAPISITVQSVLNGRIIGEDTYQYIKGKLKVGGALA